MEEVSQTSSSKVGPKVSSAPNDLTQISTIAKYEFLNFVRSRRFLSLFSLVLAVCLSASFVVEYYRPESMFSSSFSFAIHWLAYTLPFIVALPASFLGGDAISSEFQNKTGYSMIGNPIKRSSLFCGKLLAVFVSSLSILIVYEITILCNMAYNFGLADISFQFWESFGLLILAELAAIGLVLFFSSLVKNGAISIIFALFVLLYGLNLIENVYVRLINAEPWFLLTYAALTILNVFFVLNPETTIDSISWASYVGSIPVGIAIMICNFMFGTIASMTIFRRRELT